MTIRELKRELRQLQSQDNLSDDADVEIMVGGLDDRRLVKFGATTSDVRVRSAVIVPADMQSVTLEANFSNEKTIEEN